MKLFQFISYITVIFAFVIMSVLVYWFVYPYKPVEFNDLPYKIVNKTVKAGDCVDYVVDYCKYTDALPRVTRYFVDGIMYQTPETRGIVEPGCGKTTVQTQVPESLPPGEYYLKIVVEYKVNPIREIMYVNTTEKFIVTE